MPKQYKVFSVDGGSTKKWGWVLFDDNGEPLAVSAEFQDGRKAAEDQAKKTKENANAPVTGP
jgi:hypothetical protein